MLFFSNYESKNSFRAKIIVVTLLNNLHKPHFFNPAIADIEKNYSADIDANVNYSTENIFN